MNATKKKALEKCASRFLSQLPKTVHNSFPINIVYGHTLQDPVINAFSDIVQPFPGKMTHCLPCDQQKYQYLYEFQDPAIQLVKKKDHYLSRVHWMQQTQSKRKERRKTNFQTNQNIQQAFIAQFAELLETDPDKYFEGNYDWYYSGGNMETVEYEDENYVVKVGGENNESLCIHSFDVKGFSRDVVLSKKKVGHHLSQKLPIYEVTCSTNPSRVLISARQKNQLSLLAFENSDSGVNLRELSKIASPVPFISSTFDTDSWITLDVSGTIQSRDICTGLNKEKYKIERTPDLDNRWAAIRNFDRHTHLLIDRSGIKLIDTRVIGQQETPALKVDWRDNLEYTETLSCAAKSGFEHVFYIGSTFKLFAVDIRSVSDEIKATKTIRWTHNMSLAPSILKTVMQNDECSEWLACGNNLCGDLKIIINERKGTTFQSPYPPFKPTNIRDSYIVARRNGKCLRPTSQIHERIDFCTTGLALHQTDDELLLFSQNSIGDLFYQRHVPNDDVVNEFKISMKMHSWMESIRKSGEQTPLLVTDMVDFSDLCSGVLRSEKLREICASKTGAADEAIDADEPQPKWRKSVEQMRTYCDALAKDMLAIWEVDEMVERPPVIDKISDWFERSIVAESSRIEEPLAETSYVEPVRSRRKNVSRSNANKSKHVQGF